MSAIPYASPPLSPPTVSVGSSSTNPARRWLLLSYGLAAFLGIGLALVVFVQTRALLGLSDRLFHKNFPAMETISTLKGLIAAQEPILYRYYADPDTARFRKQFADNQEAIATNLARLHATLGTEDSGVCHAGLGRINQFANELVLSLDGPQRNWDHAREVLARVSQTSDMMTTEMDKVVSGISLEYQLSMSDTSAHIGTISFLVYAFAGTLLLLGGLAAVYLTRYLKAVAHQQAIALFPEKNPTPVMRLDAAGDVTYTNPAAAETLRALGLPDTEFLRLLPPDLQERIAALSQAQPPNASWEYALNDRVFSCQAHFVRDTGVFHVYPIDITEHRRAEMALEQALHQVQDLSKKLADENIYLREEIRATNTSSDIIGESPALMNVLRRVDQVAATDATVLILGESGVGKESMARAIHDRSPRHNGPFIKLNCAAIPANLVESELFGHERGAFTGAVQRRLGRFELAEGGTIFLDELGELPLDTQAKLLRVLQEREFERVGGTGTVRVSVRLIAATNRDLLKMVEAGSFRADLYYRINVFPVELPPLRKRTEDIPLLTAHFLRKFATQHGKQFEGVSAISLERLLSYHWPGNIRELQNVIERATILSTGTRLEVPPLQSSLAPTEAEPGKHAAPLKLEAVERAHILRVLSETGWLIEGKKGAAASLGLPPGTLRSRMKKLSIDRPHAAT